MVTAFPALRPACAACTALVRSLAIRPPHSRLVRRRALGPVERFRCQRCGHLLQLDLDKASPWSIAPAVHQPEDEA